MPPPFIPIASSRRGRKRGEAKPIYGYHSPIRTFLTQSIEEKQRRIAALEKGKADMLPRHGFADACPQNPPGYPHPCRFQRKKQARGYGGFAPIYDAQHLLIHFSTDLSTLRTDYAHCKTAIPPQPSAPQGCKRTAAEISVQLVRGVPTPFRRFAAWNRFEHQGTFSRKRPCASAGGPCCA